MIIIFYFPGYYMFRLLTIFNFVLWKLILAHVTCYSINFAKIASVMSVMYSISYLSVFNFSRDPLSALKFISISIYAIFLATYQCKIFNYAIDSYLQENNFKLQLDQSLETITLNFLPPFFSGSVRSLHNFVNSGRTYQVDCILQLGTAISGSVYTKHCMLH